MGDFIEFLVTFPIIVISYQMYAYSGSKTGVERQSSCQVLGVVYMTVGITSLISRQTAFVFMGLILIMFGFRLLAKGLDRVEKKVFIDHYSEDDSIKKEN